jgi:16S rRNA pseudouridine516 synthase
MVRRKDTVAGMLSAQGFGIRKDCEKMIRNGGVELGLEGPDGIAWTVAEDPEAPVAWENLHVRAKGFAFPARKHLYVAFHKPAGTECSHTPSHHQSIFTFFPEPFLNRGLEAVGRLDADTTGLLLLTDSGPFNHFLTSPRKHVSKTYRVGLKHPVTDEQIRKLAVGVELKGDDGTTLPAKAEILDPKTCDLTVQEGKYHQVKRMFAAVGNRVESIHRIAIGDLRLGDHPASGEWRLLTAAEVAALGYTEP